MSAGGILYGGDEIGALVFDVGSQSLRVGYAQEDSPKAEIPAVVGVVEDGGQTASIDTPMDVDVKPDTNNVTASGNKYFIDTNALYVARKGKEKNRLVIFKASILKQRLIWLRAKVNKQNYLKTNE